MQKLVSVCINVYNGEETIADTLRSVCDQSYKNLQIIVVDDGSVDHTVDQIAQVADSRIELYRLPQNLHISNANNESYDKIRGEYMVHIDADDIMLPGLIEKTVGYLEENPEYGACFCRPLLVDREDCPLGGEYDGVRQIFAVTAQTQAEFIRLFFDSSNHLSYAGATIRKSVIDDIGRHDVSLCYLHDFDYWTRMILKYPIHVIEEPLARYRFGTDQSHNSCLNEKKTIAHNTEYARILYRMIDHCPDNLFLAAFADRLQLAGAHTHDEVEIEKAFLLQKGLCPLPENKILSILKWASLFQNPKMVSLARERFGFRPQSLYDLQTEPILFDHAQQRHAERRQQQAIADLEARVTALAAANAAKAAEVAAWQEKHRLTEQHGNNLLAANEALRETVRLTEQHCDNLTAINESLQGEVAAAQRQIADQSAEVAELNRLLAHKQAVLNRLPGYRVAKLVRRFLHKTR